MGTAKAFGVYVSFWGVPKQGYGQYVGHLEIGPALGECKIANALIDPWVTTDMPTLSVLTLHADCGTMMCSSF